MTSFNQTDNHAMKKAENLLEEFITELDQMSSNGVVKHPDMARISDLRENYIGQCAARQQEWLAEQIDLILASKIHYFEQERKLSISELTESRIMDTIKAYVLSLKDRAPKYIGMIVSARWINPLNWAKTFLQPAVANSILTFSVVMNPPSIEQDKHAVVPGHSINRPSSEIIMPAVNRSYADMLTVKPYDDKNLNIVHQPEQKKNAVAARSSGTGNLSVELNYGNSRDEHPVLNKTENQITKQVTNESGVVRASKNPPSGPIRPQSEIQYAFYLNDQRLKNCFPVNPRQTVQQKVRVSVRFEITPAGKPKNIQFTDKSLNRNVAERLSLQITQMRFSQVENSLGDQQVLHTLFF